MLYEAYKVYRSLLGPDNVYTNVTMLQLARATRNFTNKQQEEILQAVEWFATNSKFSALYQADLEFVKVAPLMVTNANDVMTKALGHLESAESTYRCCREFDDFRWVAMRLDQCYFETVRKNLGQVRQWLVETETMLQSNELSPRHQFIFHLEAGIAMMHCRASSVESTDWQTIVNLYNRLILIVDSPIYVLNRAIARGQTGDVAMALSELEIIRSHPKIVDYFLLDCAEARLHELNENTQAAIDAYLKALSGGLAEHQKTLIEKKIKRLAESNSKRCPSQEPPR